MRGPHGQLFGKRLGENTNIQAWIPSLDTMDL